MKAYALIIFFMIGLLLGVMIGKIEQDTYTTYRLVVTGTHDGCPCMWEVWKATVPANHPDLDQVDEDVWEYNGTEHWDIVLTTSECWKYE